MNRWRFRYYLTRVRMLNFNVSAPIQSRLPNPRSLWHVQWSKCFGEAGNVRDQETSPSRAGVSAVLSVQGRFKTGRCPRQDGPGRNVNRIYTNTLAVNETDIV